MSQIARSALCRECHVSQQKFDAMTLLPNHDRVRFWNALFGQAWIEANTLAQGVNKKPKRRPTGKQNLSDDERSRLLLLAYCTLAIEARTNHLIDELVEKGRLSEAEAASLQRLSAGVKWFLLPKLAGVRKRLDPSVYPHQAIAEICASRNVLVHINFRRLSEALPSSGKMLSLFQGFVAGMEDLNVVLKRVRRARRKVIDIGVFT